jgi:hypothetical protein
MKAIEAARILLDVAKAIERNPWWWYFLNSLSLWERVGVRA